ncbi:MAG: hypothetical protein HUJ75_02150, partial [Parasporobacterium sp.]|nr:hypothetical protein [Parasporobacterium sp.]
VLNAKNRLNITVVHPSGLIGPEDYCNGSMTRMIKLYLKRKLPTGVKGGYDFSDVRDVARGVIKASEYEKSGECFILSGHYKLIKDLFSEIDQNTGIGRSLPCVPLSMAKAAAPVFEAASLRRKEKPYFTPYSIHVLGSNGLFSHEKAAELLGYTVRPVSETIRDTVEFLMAHEKIQTKKRKGIVKPVLNKSLC